ncbi:MAG: hypothetical protein IIA19_01695 [Thaumarchaeota archaeon]|nr:hypothetical protein [Nitrososphaerota archaeon]
MSDIEFLLDENVLGLGRYLDVFDIKYRKIGDENCPPKGSDDSTVAIFANEENLVILTGDDDLKKQCELSGVKLVFNDLTDFAKKVKEYADSN